MIRGQKYTFVLLATLLWTLPLLACRKQPISPTPEPPFAPTLAPHPTPTARDTQVQLALASHRTFADRSGALHVVGRAVNAAPYPCGSLLATVYYYDASGAEVARQEGPVYMDILLPGEEAPFKLSLWEPPAGIDAYAVSVTGVETSTQPFTAVTFVQDRAQMDGDSVTIVGIVQNEGPEAASQIRIAAALYDDQDTLVDVAVASAPLTVLAANHESPFRLFVGGPHVHTTPTRYELVAYSQRASAAEVDAQAQLALVDTHNYRNPVKDLVIIGEITNGGQQNATNLEAHASFFDRDGKILAVDQGYVWADILAAGTRSPFLIELFGTPQEVDHWRIWVQGQRTERQPSGPITFEETESWVDGSGAATFAGTIRNDSPQELSWIEIAVTIYDTDGQILSTGWTVLQGAIAPGASKPFQFKARAAGAADSFYLSAQGRRPTKIDGS